MATSSSLALSKAVDDGKIEANELDKKGVFMNNHHQAESSLEM